MKQREKGALSIEASISYSIFLMVLVTVLYIMRIVYAYGLIQHAVCQTAKELSMYSYVYQAAGLGQLNQDIAGATGDRTEQFNADAEDIVDFYEEFSSGNLSAGYEGTTSPAEILKNVGAAAMNQAGKGANQLLFETAARPLLAGYIGADSRGNSADERLKALRVTGGLGGLNLSSSSFFEDGQTIDLVVCYTIDPVMPLDILPSMNLASRAYIRGMNGSSIFTGEGGGSGSGTGKEEDGKKSSVWDLSPMERGKAIKDQQGIRNLPDKFSTFSAFDRNTGKATREYSMDIRDVSYQKVSGIESVLRSQCSKIENFRDTAYGGVTIKKEDIRSSELVVYIPSSSKDRPVDRAAFDQAVKKVQKQYPGIRITAKEIH